MTYFKIIVILFYSASLLKGADLSSEQETSLLSLVDRIKHLQGPQQNSRDLNIELGFAVVYCVQHNIVGPKIENVFEQIKSEIGNERVSCLVNFPDERDKKIDQLYIHATTSYPSSVTFDGALVRMIDYARPFSNLIVLAQFKLEKQTPYVFKNKKVIWDDQ